MSSIKWVPTTLCSMLLAIGIGLQLDSANLLEARPAIAATLSPVEVKNKAKAKEVTVMIQALENDSFGSGVIVRRSGNTYTVLTANHVLSGSSQFTIRTFDEATYNLKNIQPIPGVDMAIVTFDSAEVYPTAQLGDSNKLEEAEGAYVCGYPKPSEGIPVPLWQITQGNITGLANKRSREGFGEGYAIAYSNITRAGMSGGPVFNDSGELIAIHGKTSTADKSWVNVAMPINLYTNASTSQTTGSPNRERIDPQPPPVSRSQTVAQTPPESVGNSLVDPKASPSIESGTRPSSPQNPVRSSQSGTRPSSPQNPVRSSQPSFEPEVALAPQTTPQPSVSQPSRPSVNPLSTLSPYTVAIRTPSPRTPSVAPQNCRMVEQKINTIMVQKQICDGLGESTGAGSNPEKDAESLVNLGNNEFNRGNYNQAIRQYSQAVEARADLAEAYFNRGLAYGRKGDTRKAIEDLTKASDLFYTQGRTSDTNRVNEVLSQLRTFVG